MEGEASSNWPLPPLPLCCDTDMDSTLEGGRGALNGCGGEGRGG